MIKLACLLVKQPLPELIRAYSTKAMATSAAFLHGTPWRTFAMWPPGHLHTPSRAIFKNVAGE